MARRIAALALLLIVVSFLAFAMLHLAPGSPEQILLGARPADPATVEAIRDEYHLNDPFVAQYGHWLADAIRLDFGQSIRTSEPVSAAVGKRFELTAFLGIYAFVLTVGIGIPLGVIAAFRKGRGVDRFVTGSTVVGVSAPAFATGIVLIYVFAVQLPWFPTFGPGEGLADRAWHLTLPAIALALTAMALVVKITRAAVVRVLEQDYVAFARARGLSNRRVLMSYVMRNASVSIITASSLILAYMLSGAVLVEVTFALPGLGTLLIESVRTQDIPVVQGLVLLIATVVVSINLLADIAYSAVDPRITLGGADG